MVGAWPRGMRILGLALVYVALAKIPLSSNLAFQAYLFWPAAALAHTAYLLVGWEALWSLALGSLLLNGLGWLPWPQALAMVLLQTLGPLAAWRLMLRVGVIFLEMIKIPSSSG